MKLKSGDVIPYGLCIWSTGVGPTPFVTSLPFVKTDRGRLVVDECLRVLVSDNGNGGHKKETEVRSFPFLKIREQDLFQL